jgi:hypothetical protein
MANSVVDVSNVFLSVSVSLLSCAGIMLWFFIRRFIVEHDKLREEVAQLSAAIACVQTALQLKRKR